MKNLVTRKTTKKIISCFLNSATVSLYQTVKAVSCRKLKISNHYPAGVFMYYLFGLLKKDAIQLATY